MAVKPNETPRLISAIGTCTVWPETCARSAWPLFCTAAKPRFARNATTTDGMSSAHHILVVKILRNSALTALPIRTYLRVHPGRAGPDRPGSTAARPAAEPVAATARTAAAARPAAVSAWPGEEAAADRPGVDRPAVVGTAVAG